MLTATFYILAISYARTSSLSMEISKNSPLHKCKDKKCLESSYQPISLTNLTGKILKDLLLKIC